MARALELAALGRGSVSPNPMVGCVIVHQDRIIGEGRHRRYGDWHAEVNAVRSVPDDALLPESTVYVTLEPCSHFGKTPPCADLLIEKRVKRVVVCNDDPNPLVAGKGLAKLRAAGIEVETGLLAERGRELNRRFFTFFEKKRPYLILKWAETADGFIAPADFRPIPISNSRSRQLVHQWRTEEDAILVGTNTALHDDPALNVRLWQGRNPTRVVIDRYLKLPPGLRLFDGTQPTLVYTILTPPEPAHEAITYVRLEPERPFLEQLVADLYRRKIQSVIVEGGTYLLERFLNEGLWDEIRLFKSPKLLGEGLPAPLFRAALVDQERIGSDWLMHYRRQAGSGV
ncbi:bifunctional diaminohydroxyphosphoribosylaminopyrimidine deaminase/5-amino-6-(5-phosphoribosylamino)uracil reductase RibD [Larkinella soli]|uniref:bifunctional diaminohydroxyphosphoribosylaminopyrimidine deaminase/5-amino-6-(5-phosphoribosylamino)uracil reductase RibD n=1 Tax=Larkinella soli TaxID=1770527 RepID=UPI000FFB538E|nr:bifunctional diaminohydroxyphosphoribosylaminopyrimidine deaminase/5-amino-6-(5-phosphoribosylamino)uracil reductase RibD [Larkinella soli]